MNILLIQRDGVDLHHTLFASETSRMALRFYHPKKKPCGLCITVSTLGSALSLISELRWYLRRYGLTAPTPWHRMCITRGVQFWNLTGLSDAYMDSVTGNCSQES
jgi:hypothetical protein